MTQTPTQPHGARVSRDGFFPLYRKFFQHWLWTEEREFSRAEAWIDLLGLCAIEPVKRVVQDIFLTLQPGEIVASERFLCERWNWSRTKLRNFLEMLSSDGMIKRRSNQGLTILTLVNYASYALGQSGKRPAENQAKTGREPRSNQIEERTEQKRAEENPHTVETVMSYGHKLTPPASEGFARWWFDEMEAIGWVDAKGRPIMNWKAAFNSAWRGSQARESARSSKPEFVRARV